MIPIILFIVNGFVGGLLHLLISSKKLSDLKKFSNYKVLVIGAIVGYMYYFLHSDYNFPNGIMTIVAGYMGQDFITKVFNKFGGKV